MKIIIPFAAYSLNNYYYNDKRHGKRREAKDWEYQVNNVLSQHCFKQLKASFAADKHGLKVEMNFFYKSFFNRAGTVSSKVFDLSNCEKPLLDLLLNPVNHGPSPYHSPNLNIDDKHVIELVSRKLPADEDRVEVTIELIPLKGN